MKIPVLEKISLLIQKLLVREREIRIISFGSLAVKCYKVVNLKDDYFWCSHTK